MPGSNGLTEDDFRAKLAGLRNWNRWGGDDQRGAVNLVTPAKVRRAAALIEAGLPISMAREYPKHHAPNNPNPAHQFMRRNTRGDGTAGSAVDHLSIAYHGQASTHLDALCHVWNRDGMWNGRDPDDAFTFDGMTWAGIEHWVDGITTRGVLLDVARRRPDGYVDVGEPVTGEELDAIVQDAGIACEPGDALVIHCGREAWERAHSRPWSAPGPNGERDRPGLDESCLDFFHAADCSLILWDMMDERPNNYGVVHSTHAALFNQGVGLLDNALIEPVAQACATHGRTDFFVSVAPLRIVGGTGSPVNPIAIL